MAIVIDASTPALGRSSGAYYSFQAGDLLIKFTGERPPPGWTVFPVPHSTMCWHRATQAGTCPASDLAFPPIRPNPPESTGASGYIPAARGFLNDRKAPSPPHRQ